MPARPFLATSRWLRLTMGDNGTKRRQRRRERETEKKIGLLSREWVLGLQAISRTLFRPIPPPPNVYFPTPSDPSSFFYSDRRFLVFVVSSLPPSSRRGPALIYLHPRARRRRRGVFIFCPASTRCKVYRRDLHRFAFCFPSSCSVVVVLLYACHVHTYTNENSHDPCLRDIFVMELYVYLCYSKRSNRFLHFSIFFIAF